MQSKNRLGSFRFKTSLGLVFGGLLWKHFGSPAINYTSTKLKAFIESFNFIPTEVTQHVNPSHLVGVALAPKVY